jgi:hypothetical protein
LPGWVRLATLVGAIGGIASLAFFPSALVILWALAIGVWLVAAGGRLETPAAARAG